MLFHSKCHLTINKIINTGTHSPTITTYYLPIPYLYLFHLLLIPLNYASLDILNNLLFISMDKFRTRNEFAENLGLSTRSLERKLIALQIELPKGLLSPKDQLMIREVLGFID
jgi:hypothetical protein